MNPGITWCCAMMIAGFAQAQAPGCEAEPGREAATLSAEAAAGAIFVQPAGARWLLRLNPIRYGWHMEILEQGREQEDLSALTPPFHGPNPRYLLGGHFRNSSNTGPNDGSVNAPQAMREFIFSPDVGRTLGFFEGSDVTLGDVERVSAYGRGWLYVHSYVLTPPAEGETASFESIAFTACLTWPR